MKNNFATVVLSVVAAIIGVWSMQAEITVASLNPITSDLVRQVGGERITVAELMRVGENPHIYEPSPAQLRQAASSDLVLAAGMGLETYLPDLRDSLGRGKRILEVGNSLPPLKLRDDKLFLCCPGHEHSSVDPHWWHSIKNLQRATVIIETTLTELDPEGGQYFRERGRSYRHRLDELEKWARKEIYRIPRKDRVLTTTHTAFSYFCRDFGFKAVPLRGLSTEVAAEPHHLAAVVETIKKERIKAIFPEKYISRKLLDSVARESGVRIGAPLLSGTPEPVEPTCEAMFRYNVQAIVRALAPKGTE